MSLTTHSTISFGIYFKNRSLLCFIFWVVCFWWLFMTHSNAQLPLLPFNVSSLIWWINQVGNHYSILYPTHGIQIWMNSSSIILTPLNHLIMFFVRNIMIGATLTFLVFQPRCTFTLVTKQKVFLSMLRQMSTISQLLFSQHPIFRLESMLIKFLVFMNEFIWKRLRKTHNDGILAGGLVLT